MEFSQPRSIYQQIADQIKNRIYSGEWKEGERIPSVREMAASTGVNPNTVTRSYQSLTGNGVIQNRRGIGYFVAESAGEQISKEIRKQLISTELPWLFGAMRQAGIGMDELGEMYNHFINENETEEKEQ